MSNLKRKIKEMKKELKMRQKKGLFSLQLRHDIIILEAFANVQ